MRKLLLLLLFSSAILGACVSNDPNKGGFFGGLKGIYSGAYDNRIKHRTEELGRQQETNQALKEKSLQLEGEAKAWEQELNAECQRLDDMEENLAVMERELGELNASSEQQKSQISKLKKSIAEQTKRIKSQQAALKSLEKSAGGAADVERYRVLQQERKRLADEYSKLLKYSEALANATR
jgi:chromosome segregation ATPase